MLPDPYRRRPIPPAPTRPRNLPVTSVNHKGEITGRWVDRDSPVGRMFAGTARVVTSTNHLGETTVYTLRTES